MGTTMEDHGYDRTFWLAYLANGLTTVANAMLVRYADFVTALGGEERQLGLIVGCGMVGSIVIRFGQGVAIDRWGAGRIWQLSMVLYTASLLLHLTLDTAYSPAIFIVRALMQSSLAGVFGSSITFVSLRTSPAKMAEMIGALGTSGFIGIALGPLVSDWLAAGDAAPRDVALRMLSVASIFAAVSTVATWLATRHSAPPPHRRRPPVGLVVRRYLSVVLGVTGAAMGAGFSIPMTFLRPFTAEAQLGAVGVFFFVYATTAFVARVGSRELFERYGNRPWILAGLSLLTISFLLYLPVTRAWQLAIPGAMAGIAHALLFPSVMAEGTGTFPRRYLGVATSVMLASFDIGTLIGAPVVGAFLRYAKQHSEHAYQTMFAGVA
ncbi:MAG TPA: MFS transporter, partial [Pirellulaceae bacterium]|nr:MFS transporter [Pirellulaceae bacterium]